MHTLDKLSNYPLKYLYNILTLNTMFKAEKNLENLDVELAIINYNTNNDVENLDNYIADQKRMSKGNFKYVGMPSYFDQPRDIKALGN